jgi:dienelactone hydrolase
MSAHPFASPWLAGIFALDVCQIPSTLVFRRTEQAVRKHREPLPRPEGSDDTTPNHKEQTMAMQGSQVEYTAGETSMRGYLARPTQTAEARIGVLVFPEWWGLTPYLQQRAEQLAELGYVALAVDMYGAGQLADNPTDAGALMNGILNDMPTGEQRILAGLDFLKSQADVDSDRIGAIGYCFGGAIVLHCARRAYPIKAVASFHGSLGMTHQATPGEVHAKILVCHGDADAMVSDEQLQGFVEEMEHLKADCTLKRYPEALHGFTNPATNELGKQFGLPIGHNEQADQQSWDELKAFFAQHL